MRQTFEDPSAEDRRVYRKLVRGLFACYAGMVIVAVGVVLGSQIPRNFAHQLAAAASISEKPPIRR